ncbi:DUF6233 domain-containing protein [Streptomyces sp. NPDC086989]|uniref:DUF6233 domain-containing protein n=1 Tax=Streptomyces sp. NPDC086989 TaxID=3365764 RepID=UPI00381D6714
MGVQRQPTRVHTSDCPQGPRSRSVTRDMAMEVLRTVPSVIACPLCRPDRELGLLDLQWPAPAGDGARGQRPTDSRVVHHVDDMENPPGRVRIESRTRI